MSLIKLKGGSLKNEINIALPGSKSESNRALILNFISNGDFEISGLSEAKDTETLQELLAKIHTDKELNCGPAGTTFRFLTALLSFTPGKRTLTGSPRMFERPIKDLVDALKKLGAKIHYLKKEGYPPLLIEGVNPAKKGETEVRVDASSQYLTALLLISPLFKEGLQIKTLGKLGSEPYVDMTCALLSSAGFKASKSENEYQVETGAFSKESFQVEADWSAASYWYSWAAINKGQKVNLLGLKKDSLQGDAVCTQIFDQFGVSTTFFDWGIQLVNSGECNTKIELDFTHCPDLAQTVFVTCAALKVEGHFKGLQSLRIKETDRIAAMQTELNKLGASLEEINPGIFKLSPGKNLSDLNPRISTYEDHRMAMAFAPLANQVQHLEIENPSVVEKSYPSFWEDVKNAGAELKSM